MGKGDWFCAAGGLSRVCFNFGSVCNMRCPWCYIPFNGSRIEINTCHQIVNRCADLGAKIITFGGGDPFAFHAFASLLEHASQRGMLVHVDTNGLSLRERHFAALTSHVDLLALPLDAPSSELHDLIRVYPGHFNMVLGLLRDLQGTGIKLKLNTLTCAQNVDTIPEMVGLVETIGCDRWSVYQYWPLSLGKRVADTHAVDDERFKALATRLPSRIGKCVVEMNLVSERRGTYFFVSHDGIVYVHDILKDGEYSVLGSIFDDATIERWIALEIPSVRPRASSRYETA